MKIFVLNRDVRRTLLSVVLALGAAMSGCGGGSPGPVDTQPPVETIGQVVLSSARAAQSGVTYDIRTFLPASYPGGTALLPAIFVTEGDAPYGISNSGSGAVKSRFDVFKESMQRRGTQALLVGISGTARRGTDFLLPGAAQYVDFIAKDLAPSIERQYRADPKRRALSGLSHGGYFVVAALVLEGSAGTLSFSHYLSTESSIGAHSDLAAYLEFEKQLDAAGKPVAATLFLAGARGSNGPAVVYPLYAQMASHAHPGLTLLKAEYDTTHVGAELPAFEEALTRFFP